MSTGHDFGKFDDERFCRGCKRTRIAALPYCPALTAQAAAKVAENNAAIADQVDHAAELFAHMRVELARVALSVRAQTADVSSVTTAEAWTAIGLCHAAAALMARICRGEWVPPVTRRPPAALTARPVQTASNLVDFGTFVRQYNVQTNANLQLDTRSLRYAR